VRVGIGLAIGDLPKSGAADFHTARQVHVRTNAPLGFHVDGDYVGEASAFDVALTPLALEVAT